MEMERRHEVELIKITNDHDQLEAYVRCPQGDEQSTHTLPKRTQGESYPRPLHSRILTLRPNKFIDSLCKNSPDSIDELRERANGYIQMEEISIFRNKVHQARQKLNKCKVNAKADSYKSDKRHRLDKPASLQRAQTITKQKQDPEDINRSNTGTGKQTEEEWKTEADKDNNMSNNLHQNKNLPSTSESQNQHLQAIQGININFFDAPLQRSLPPITFTDRDFKGINPVNQDDPMGFSINILNFMVSRVLIDQGSSVDILY
ncbi:hypothetical protein JHK86_006694 [Glycine max]|nr:hypothetical protein JHK86_006694 [Glycine max]